MGVNKAYRWTTVSGDAKGLSGTLDGAVEDIAKSLGVKSDDLYLNGFAESIGEVLCYITINPIPESLDRSEVYPPLLDTIQVVVIPERNNQ